MKSLNFIQPNEKGPHCKWSPQNTKYVLSLYLEDLKLLKTALNSYHNNPIYNTTIDTDIVTYINSMQQQITNLENKMLDLQKNVKTNLTKH